MFDPGDLRLRERLESGACLDAVWLSLGSVALCEIAARCRPGVIVIDMQHGLWDRLTLEAAIGVARADAPVMVRLADHTPNAVAQALDAGAAGVLAPLVETGAQAAAIGHAARFPPLGSRSGGGVRPLQDFVPYVRAANRAIVVGAMIETRAGVDDASAIASVPNIDFVFIGAGDLALSLGDFPAFGRAHEAACAAILSACAAQGRPCGIFTPSLQAAAAMRVKGYRMVVTASDIELARNGFAEAARAFANASTVGPPTSSTRVGRGRAARTAP